MQARADGRTKVFVSYSHNDSDWLKRLQVHLRPLERRGLVELWDDTRIQAGSQWRQEISDALNSACVAVLLVSADFIASDFIADEELPPLLAAAEQRGLKILPLILSPSRFEKIESLARFQSVNPPSKPLIKLRRSAQEEFLVKLSDDVLRATADVLPLSSKAQVTSEAIKGLLPFGYSDAEDFAHLKRDQNLKECLQAMSDEYWRFGFLSGESGAGKTSLLQAGLWPALEKLKFRCVYVKFSDLDPLKSVQRACRKHLPECRGAAENADFLTLLSAATTQDRSPVVILFDQFEQFFIHSRQESDRAAFVQALTQWYTEMESLPVKLLSPAPASTGSLENFVSGRANSPSHPAAHPAGKRNRRE